MMMMMSGLPRLNRQTRPAVMRLHVLDMGEGVSWTAAAAAATATGEPQAGRQAGRVTECLRLPCCTVNMSALFHLQSNVDDNGSGDGLLLLVELWRSDLVTSVIELDSEGNVMGVGDHEELEEMYPPGRWWVGRWVRGHRVWFIVENVGLAITGLPMPTHRHLCSPPDAMCTTCPALLVLGSAGLLLGVGSDVMVEYHISAFLPQLADK